MKAKSRNLTEILSTVMRLAGIPLILWAPNEAAFWVGIGLVLGKDVSSLVLQLSPKTK